MRNLYFSGLFGLMLALIAVNPASAAALRTAKYATEADTSVIDINGAKKSYDIVYVRCPRAGREIDSNGNFTGNIRPVTLSLKDSQGKPIQVQLDNWNGANDIWLSAANNMYHQPGCDLVLHHTADGYKGLPQGHPGREEVLVNCDTLDASKPICSIADPNVSFDGKRIVYTKFTDTREQILDTGVSGEAGLGASPGHKQLFLQFYPDGDARGPWPYARSRWQYFKGFKAPALIYVYDLEIDPVTGKRRGETRVSPPAKMFSGLAYPLRGPGWQSKVPVMDAGPFFMHDGRIGFTSNRQNGYFLFQLFAMDEDGSNLTLLGYRAMNQQLHPFVLKDGRIAYTSFDRMLQKGANNQYSLFTINPDESDPFILAGKYDATQNTWHFATQLSDGDIVSTIYYNGNNSGMGSLRRFPIDPPGPDFENIGSAAPGEWKHGTKFKPFARVGESILTAQGDERDKSIAPYADPNDDWIHPGRSATGIRQIIGGKEYFLDKSEIVMKGKFTHPAAAPNNDLLVTYTIGGSSNFSGYQTSDMAEILKVIGKDAGIWLLPLEPNLDPLDPKSARQVNHIADDGLIVVDSPYYQEIMSRAVIPYADIYGIARPGIDDKSSTGETMYVKPTENLGQADARLPKGAPYGLSGASSLYDRETRPVNGFPWNAPDTGGTMSGRDYTNLSTAGAELAIFDNEEIYGVRVLMPVPPTPLGYAGGRDWAGQQKHQLRILGEFPVRKADSSLIDLQANPDTSFLVRLPADTPFLFQTLDKRGMALDIETTSRALARGEQQMCEGCHVHTRDGMDPYQSVAKLNPDPNAYGDFTGNSTALSAPLFTGNFDVNGNPTKGVANVIYKESLAPGVNSRRSFAIDWKNGIADIIQNRCASCHAEGRDAQILTGLRLDNDVRTYFLLIRNEYRREDGTPINWKYKPGDGLNDVINNTPGTDRITWRGSCCTTSRWISSNSARSSMLIWALYGDRLDGRNPETGFPWGAKGESIPDTVPQALRDIPVDKLGLDRPDVWPGVAQHAALPEIQAMPENEKRLLARWIDIGAPLQDVHNDTMRPVLTITPEIVGGSVSRVYVGLWDDSPLDYTSFSITGNDSVNIAPVISVRPENDNVLVDLGVTITSDNADSVSFTFEIWDKPDRRFLVKMPDTPAANRTRKTLTGRALLRMANATPNATPTDTRLTIETPPDTPSRCLYPTVSDPDKGNVHTFSVMSQPVKGSVQLANNCFIYTPKKGFTGSDSFTYMATDLGGLSVSGTANVTVKLPDNQAPTATDARIVVITGQSSSPVLPAVYDPDVGDTHTFIILTQPTNGSATIEGNRLVYTANVGYVGNDSFTYRATDEGGLSVDGIASVMVSAAPTVNSSPTSASARIKVVQGQTSAPVVPNVSDPDAGDVHTFEIRNQPGNGTARIVNGRLVYTPDANFVGGDSFTFTARDLGGLSVTGTAIVTVTEAPVSAGGGRPDNGGGTSSQASDGANSGGGATALGELFGLLFSLMLFGWMRHGRVCRADAGR